MSFAVRRLVALDESTVGAPASAAPLVAALGAPDTAVLLRGAPFERAILAGLPANVPVVAVLPDMGQLLRDASDRGLPAAALTRLRRGGLGGLARLAITGASHLPAIVRQDFAGLLPMLLALERGGLGRVSLRGVALTAPMTDLLLASDYGACVAGIVRFVRGTLGVSAGFETLNLGHLLPALARWSVSPDFLMGPLNARGFRMKPSADAVRAAITPAAPAVLASEVTARRRIPTNEAVEWAHRAGAAGVVVTIADLVAGTPPP